MLLMDCCHHDLNGAVESLGPLYIDTATWAATLKLGPYKLPFDVFCVYRITLACGETRAAILGLASACWSRSVFSEVSYQLCYASFRLMPIIDSLL